MKRIEVTTDKYRCDHCGRTFDDILDCESHESFCQSAEPRREITKKLASLLAQARKIGVDVYADYASKILVTAEMDEATGIVYLLPVEG